MQVRDLDARNRTELLRTYVDVVVLCDVLERHNLSLSQPCAR